MKIFVFVIFECNGKRTEKIANGEEVFVGENKLVGYAVSDGEKQIVSTLFPFYGEAKAAADQFTKESKKKNTPRRPGQR